MNTYKIFKLDNIRFLKSKYYLGFIFVELIIFFTFMLSDNPFTNLNKKFYITQYFSVQLMSKYLCLSVLTTLFISYDIKNGIIKTYIASGIDRISILKAKILSILSFLMLNTLINIFICILVSFLYQKQNTSTEILTSLFIALLPQLVFVLFTVFIDFLFQSTIVTILISWLLILLCTFVPYEYAKYIFISYSNPILVMKYAGNNDVTLMYLVLLVSAVILIGLDCFIAQNSFRE